jgi:hypothetical protein
MDRDVSGFGFQISLPAGRQGISGFGFSDYGLWLLFAGSGGGRGRALGFRNLYNTDSFKTSG